jgi:hypothetical protein
MESAGLWCASVADILLFLGAQRGHFGLPWPELAQVLATPVARVDSRTRMGLGWFVSEIPGTGTAQRIGSEFGFSYGLDPKRAVGFRARGAAMDR